MARRLAAAALVAGLLAGCGEKAEPAPSRARTVTGTLDLGRPPAGPPDGGTQGGHRTPDGTASTTRASLAFTGRVDPASSRVTLRPASGEPARVRVGPEGHFRARARGLKRGANRFVLEGRAPGLEAWTAEISITRR